MSEYHNPVLLNESIDALVWNRDGVYADATFGGGGHSRAILAALSEKGWDVLTSKTNFLFASPVKMSAESVYTKLRGKGILVRYFNKPRINQYLRITIGTDEEMDAFLRAVEEIMEGKDA